MMAAFDYDLGILDGGAAGLTAAAGAAQFGAKTVLVEKAQALGGEDPDIVGIVRSRLEAEGVKVLAGTKVLKASFVNSSIRVRVAPTKGEGEPRTIEGDVLLVAAGSYYSGKLFSDRTRKVLRFLFGLKGRASVPEETDR